MENLMFSQIAAQVIIHGDYTYVKLGHFWFGKDTPENEFQALNNKFRAVTGESASLLNAILDAKQMEVELEKGREEKPKEVKAMRMKANFDLIQEKVKIIDKALELKGYTSEFYTIDDWLRDPDWAMVEEADGIKGLGSITFAHGYLQGCADTLDLTISEFLDHTKAFAPEADHRLI